MPTLCFADHFVLLSFHGSFYFIPLSGSTTNVIGEEKNDILIFFFKSFQGSEQLALFFTSTNYMHPDICIKKKFIASTILMLPKTTGVKFSIAETT